MGFENTICLSTSKIYIASCYNYICTSRKNNISMNVVASVSISSNWNLECEWKFEDKIGTGCTENVKRSRANLFLVF